MHTGQCFEWLCGRGTFGNLEPSGPLPGTSHRYRPDNGRGANIGAAEVKCDRSAGFGDRGWSGGRIEAGVRGEAADGNGVGVGHDPVKAVGAATRRRGGGAVAEIDGYTVDPHALDRNLTRDRAGRRRRNNVLSGSRDDREHQQRRRRAELPKSFQPVFSLYGDTGD